MQFVVLVKATADSEAEVFRPEQFTEMGAFNDQLAKDGVLLAAGTPFRSISSNANKTSLRSSAAMTS